MVRFLLSVSDTTQQPTFSSAGDTFMLKVIKKYIWYGVIILFVYALLAYHYIYVGGKDVRFLKKEHLNLRYTFYSLQGKSPESILKIDVLRYAGIGDILVDIGMVDEEQKNALEYKFDYEE
jgi:hypothetical protein